MLQNRLDLFWQSLLSAYGVDELIECRALRGRTAFGPTPRVSPAEPRVGTAVQPAPVARVEDAAVVDEPHRVRQARALVLDLHRDQRLAVDGLVGLDEASPPVRVTARAQAAQILRDPGPEFRVVGRDCIAVHGGSMTPGPAGRRARANRLDRPTAVRPPCRGAR
jgi:hypothetical protein